MDHGIMVNLQKQINELDNRVVVVERSMARVAHHLKALVLEVQAIRHAVDNNTPGRDVR